MKHYLGICLVLLTLAGIVLFAVNRCENAAVRTAASIARTFQTVLQMKPEIRINQTVITTQTSPIAELAVVSKEELVNYSILEKYQFMQHDVPLTGKSITAQAVYRLKAGYDLREPFRVEIDSATHRITAQLPPAKILSVERIGDLTLQDHDAWLNRITPEERQKVLNELDKTAHQTAEHSGLIEDAEHQVVARLQELAALNGQKFFFRDSPRN